MEWSLMANVNVTSSLRSTAYLVKKQLGNTSALKDYLKMNDGLAFIVYQVFSIQKHLGTSIQGLARSLICPQTSQQ
jgi:hypothetical protein